MLSNILTVIIFIILFNNIPFFIENKKGKEIEKKYTILWGIFACVLSLVVFHFAKLPLKIEVIITSLITTAVGIIINLNVRGNLKRQKLYIRSLLVLFLFFFSSLFQLIPIALFHINTNNISNKIENYLSLFSNFCLLLTLLFLYRHDLKEDFKIFSKDKMKNMDIGFKYWFIGLIVMIIGNTLILFLLPKANAGNEQAVQEMIHMSPWISLISTGFFAPIIEEITFRKTFRDMIKNDTLFILISGMIFGSLHVVLSISSIYDLAYLVPYCALGISFGYIYAKTKTVFTSISIHMIHNIALTLLSIASTLVILW